MLPCCDESTRQAYALEIVLISNLKTGRPLLSDRKSRELLEGNAKTGW